MERLTEIQSGGYDLKELNGEWCNKYCEKQKAQTCRKCGIYQAIQKLAEYEDLEEQGLLLRLSVPIGTNDECKWEQTSTARYKTSCGYKLEEYFDTNACYCKQCGKKIKVVH